MTAERLEEEFSNLVDSTTALVGVTDEGLKGAATELGRIAEGVDSLRGALPVVPTDIGSLIGAAIRESLAPVQGTPGRDGVDGKPGLDGTPGKPGRDGKAGRDGVDGIDGLPGRSGKAGVKGDQGPRGFDGVPGPTSVRVTVERENQLIAFANVFNDDGSTKRMAVRRDANRRFTELVRVSA